MDVEFGPSAPALAFPGPSQAGFPANYASDFSPAAANPSFDTTFNVAGNVLNQRGFAPHVDGGIPRKMRKRKAESQDNERLSKRLSLLNLEQNGQKLYVPVESPHLRPTTDPSSSPSLSSLTRTPEGSSSNMMQLDDTKHKVYIYNLDDELSDSGSSSSNDNSDTNTNNGGNSGNLLFLPDIDRHLRQARIHIPPLSIPPPILPNRDGELAGMQVVLYREPASLTVPEEQDSVRKAIVEARARHRQRQKEELAATTTTTTTAAAAAAAAASPTPFAPSAAFNHNNNNNAPPGTFQGNTGFTNHDRMATAADPAVFDDRVDDDPDAMDMD
ncbi:hypothetical protein F4779DRAFT_615131 [Xylariaceae sp. FL0662B]|nr:hypothetical protein F4779DRAFT_615131 [Xylariaceae sp. FL0662B]